MDIQTLTQIYNTMLTIDTRGDATMKMAACIEALQNVIKTAQAQEKQMAAATTTQEAK